MMHIHHHWTVPRGGHLFHHFLFAYSSDDDRRLLKRLLTRRTRVDIPIEYEDFEQFLIKYKNRFYVYLLLVLNGYAVKWQRYYLSFLMEFKGASRSGLSVLSALGLGNPVRTYDTYRKGDVDKVTNELR